MNPTYRNLLAWNIATAVSRSYSDSSSQYFTVSPICITLVRVPPIPMKLGLSVKISESLLLLSLLSTNLLFFLGIFVHNQDYMKSSMKITSPVASKVWFTKDMLYVLLRNIRLLILKDLEINQHDTPLLAAGRFI